MIRPSSVKVRLTERERREAGEYLRAAKSESTRERRAESIVQKLRGPRGNCT